MLFVFSDLRNSFRFYTSFKKSQMKTLNFRCLRRTSKYYIRVYRPKKIPIEKSQFRHIFFKPFFRGTLKGFKLSPNHKVRITIRHRFIFIKKNYHGSGKIQTWDASVLTTDPPRQLKSLEFFTKGHRKKNNSHKNLEYWNFWKLQI